MIGPAKIDHVRANEKDFIVLVSIVISYEAANVKNQWFLHLHGWFLQAQSQMSSLYINYCSVTSYDMLASFTALMYSAKSVCMMISILDLARYTAYFMSQYHHLYITIIMRSHITIIYIISIRMVIALHLRRLYLPHSASMCFKYTPYL